LVTLAQKEKKKSWREERALKNNWGEKRTLKITFGVEDTRYVYSQSGICNISGHFSNL